MDCLFCKIVAKQIPASIVYENDRLIAFKDINPQAPTHVLVVPRRHIPTLNDLTNDDDDLVGEMVRVAAEIAGTHGHTARGYRTVLNSTRTPVRPCSTSTCTSSAAAR